MIYYDKDNIKVRDSIKEDCYEVAYNMRKSDIEEIWASHNHTPLKALLISFKYSTLCLTVEVNGEPVCIFGCVPDSFLGDSASVWLLGTDEFNKFMNIKNIEFLRYSRRFINYMLSFYPYLYNYVDDRNKTSIRWLKWCGCKMNGAITYGMEKLPFHFFEFKRS